MLGLMQFLKKRTAAPVPSYIYIYGLHGVLHQWPLEEIVDASVSSKFKFMQCSSVMKIAVFLKIAMTGNVD